MRFETPGLTQGPTDDDLEHLERFRMVVKVPSGDAEDAAQAERLGLSLEQFRALRASLAGLNAGR